MYDCDCFVDCFLSGRSGSFQPRFTHLSSPVDGLQSQAKTEMQDFGPRVDGCWWVNCHTNNTNVLSVYIIHASACVCVYLHHVCMCMHTWHVCRCVFEKEMDTGSSYIFSSDYIIKFFTGHEWVGGGDQNDQFSFLRILVFLLWNVSFAIITILLY